MKLVGVAGGAGVGAWLGDRAGNELLPPPPPDALPTTDDLAPTIDTGDDVYILVRTSGEGAEDTFAWYFDVERSSFYEQHPTIWDGRYLKVSDARAAELTDQCLQVALPVEDYSRYREQKAAIEQGASEAVVRVIGGGTPTGEPLFEWIELDGGAQRMWTRDGSGNLIGLIQRDEHVLEMRYGSDGRIDRIAEHNAVTGESRTLAGAELDPATLPTPNPHAWADEPRPALSPQAALVPPLLEGGGIAEATAGSPADHLGLAVPGNPNAPGYHAHPHPGEHPGTDPNAPFDLDIARAQAGLLIAQGQLRADFFEYLQQEQSNALEAGLYAAHDLYRALRAEDLIGSIDAQSAASRLYTDRAPRGWWTTTRATARRGSLAP